MRAKICLSIIAAVTPVTVSAQAIHLVCGGSGTATRTQSTTAYGTNSYGESATATVHTRRDRAFADQVNVEINGNEGRIRLPRTMLPVIRGGEGGWMRLTDIRQTESEIIAKAYINPMSRPDVRIDRLTGAISIDGRAGQYSGQCEAYDPATVQRRF